MLIRVGAFTGAHPAGEAAAVVPAFSSENFLDAAGKAPLSAYRWADANDARPAANDLTVQAGAPAFTAGFVVFDGSSGLSRANTGLSGGFPAGTTAADFTITGSVVFNDAGGGSDQCVVGKDASFNLLSGSGHFNLFVWDATSTFSQLVSATTIVAGALYPWAFRYTHAMNKVELFVAGAKEAEATMADAMQVTTQDFYVGASGIFSKLNGKVGEIGIFTGTDTLSDDEIANIANHGLADENLGMFYDDFTRADTANGAYGTPPRGQTAPSLVTYTGSYPLVATGEGRVSGRAFVADTGQVVYAMVSLPAQIRRWKARVSFLQNPSFDAGQPADGEATAAFIVGGNANLIQRMGMHVRLTQANGASFEKRRTDEAFPIPQLGTIPAATLGLRNDGTIYDLEASVAANGDWTLTVDRHTISGNDAEIAGLLSGVGAFEIYQAGANCYNSVRIHGVSAYAE